MSATETGRARTATGVVVLDDHPAVRIGLKRLLEREPGLVPLAVLDGEDALWDVLARERPGVVVLDHDLVHGDGMTLCLRIKERPAAPGVLIYSAYEGPALAVPAAVAQADGLLDKSRPVAVLLDTIRLIARGRRSLPPVSPSLLAAAAARLRAEDLPVMAMLIDRATPREVADALGVDEAEVGRRSRRILGRLQAGARPPR